MQLHYHRRGEREYVALCDVIERTAERIVCIVRHPSILKTWRIELRKTGFRITEDCYVIALEIGEPVTLSAGAYVDCYQDNEYIGTGRFYESGSDIIHIEEVREEVEHISKEAE